MNQRKKILVAPLDWGLGHATRCIPIIKELLQQNVDVIIAADGRPYELLRREFPTLTFVRLPGFAIAYSGGDGIALKIIQQIPKIVFSTFREHRTLKRLIRELKFDAVISDNRFGLFSRKITCVYVTHQICIMMPQQFEWASRLAYHLNKLIIQRYDTCWIPDYAGEENLSGRLSHYYPLPKNATHIGPLTRFKKYSNVTKEYDVLVVLSGPEPQRTVLENIMMEQLKTVQCTSLVVRGIPEINQRIKLSESLSVVSSLDSESLNIAMLAADIIISRPGYSTIMDLAALGKKAIFIPTPGQTEQEYLAGEFEKNKLFCAIQQQDFNLSRALQQAKHYSGFAKNESINSALSDKIQQLLLHTGIK